MEQTVFDLDRKVDQGRASPTHTASVRWVLIASIAVCVGVTLLFLRKHSARVPLPQPVLFQSQIVLPDPAPLAPPAVIPTVTASPPPTMPAAVAVAPSRLSIWEIRAELKRGIGEWEFPHYLNAPHYGAGPDSPPPALAKPHLATQWVGE